jgi:hypothetical protein
MTDTRAPLARCQSALHVALNATLDAIDAGHLTPETGQELITLTKEALGIAVLADLNDEAVTT